MEAAGRIGYDASAYEAPEYEWARGCHVVALVWLWDELLFDHAAGRFTPERFCAEAERGFGGFDGITLDELVRRTISVAGAPAAA